MGTKRPIFEPVIKIRAGQSHGASPKSLRLPTPSRSNTKHLMKKPTSATLCALTIHALMAQAESSHFKPDASAAELYAIVVNQPGTLPDENIESVAVTLANTKGESRDYAWPRESIPENRTFQNMPEDPGEAFESAGFDQTERAWQLIKKADVAPNSLETTIKADDGHPIVNPAFVIKNWGHRSAEVHGNGKSVPRGSDFRLGHRHTFEGTDIVWLKLETNQPPRALGRSFWLFRG